MRRTAVHNAGKWLTSAAGGPTLDHCGRGVPTRNGRDADPSFPLPFLHKTKERPMKRAQVAIAGLLLIFSVAIVSRMVSAAEKSAEEKPAAEKQPGFRPLFDGKTLAGWHPVGDGQWTVEDGAIVGRAEQGEALRPAGQRQDLQGFHRAASSSSVSRATAVSTSARSSSRPRRPTACKSRSACNGSGVGGSTRATAGRGWSSRTDEEKKVVQPRRPVERDDHRRPRRQRGGARQRPQARPI